MSDAAGQWGRVDDDGTVYVIDADGERVVGQYPDATPEEALAYFARKFSDLDGQVTLLEQRIAAGAPATDVAKSAAHLQQAVASAKAVGDLASLRARLERLGGAAHELTAQQSADAKAAVAAALAEREQIVVEAEQLAAGTSGQVQWKQLGSQMDELFERWQRHQQDGPKLPKGEAQALWTRFRAARSTVEAGRKHFFAEMDAQHRVAKDRKQALVERAEALAPQGATAIPSYRNLLEEWKLAGRAGKRIDDALWEKFKAAGDVLYGAKAEEVAKEDAEYGANLTVKLALLDEGEAILKLKDRAAARTKLAELQRRWEAIGKVPREQVRAVEDRMRKVEAHVRSLEEEHWQRTDPEKLARSEGFAAQLNQAIAKLEAELAEAEARGDAKAVAAAKDALANRRMLLAALG